MKLFGETRQLIEEIDLFFDAISKSGLTFKAGVQDYMNGRLDRVEDRARELSDLENQADLLRRRIIRKLYARMLLPDVRGDVLGLLESSDNVIDRAKKLVYALDIEKPEIPENLIQDYIDLADASYMAIDAMVKAARSYFTKVELVTDYVNKVAFFEKEADKLEDRIKRIEDALVSGTEN